MPITTYTAGQVLTAASLNSNFSAAGGLQFIKAQTIGTAVSAVTVTGAFSATYDNYLVIVSGGVASADTSLVLTLGSTTTGYYWLGSSQQYGSTTLTSTFVNNGAAFQSVVYGSTNALSGQCVIDNPFATKRTMVRYEATGSSTTYFRNQAQGFLDNATSYTAFTLTTSAGTVTGGTIRVYGYANS
jgi:uncharacterized protein YhjY with autotransporter beta-barrel domain